MRVSSCGDSAFIITVEDDCTDRLGAVLTLHDALQKLIEDGQMLGVRELVPAAETILVIMESPLLSLSDLKALVGKIDLSTTNHLDDDADAINIDVDYGAGLDFEVLEQHIGMNREDLISWHTSTQWVAAFGGFAPGFMYLVPTNAHDALSIPRRESPRTQIPAGAVALAGNFSAVYPQQSPGGWQIIGSTSSPMWDLERTQPSLITPGDKVRFTEIAR